MKKLVLIIFAAIFLNGCQSDGDQETIVETVEAESAVVSERVTRQRSVVGEAAIARSEALGDPARRIPRLEGQFEEPGAGLMQIVDGSSPEAFAQSLQLIAAETSAEQFNELDTALRFLGLHSSAAWGGLPGLYKSLHDMTGEEIIEHAGRLAAELGR